MGSNDIVVINVVEERRKNKQFILPKPTTSLTINCDVKYSSFTKQPI